jgi:hypothetical protein
MTLTEEIAFQNGARCADTGDCVGRDLCARADAAVMLE